MNAKTFPLLAFSGLVAATLIACTGGAGSTARPTVAPTSPATPAPTSTIRPSPSPSASPSPTQMTVESAAQAAARVFASDERWARMTPLRPDMIGQSSWYEAFEDGDGFGVEITVGQGDCIAGCIERRTWTYHVARAGAVELVSEEGDDVDLEQPAGGDGPARVTAQLLAGPTCPVETVPPDPNCAPRPVDNADVVVYDPDGNQVARETSDDEGMVSLDVPAGAYYIESQSDARYMGAPEAQAFAVLGGDEIGLLFSYDTGIR